MSIIRLAACLAAVLTPVLPLRAALIWSADFESYNTGSGAATLTLSSSGANDTFTSTTTSSATLASYAVDVRSYGGDNALYISETGNGTAGTASVRLMQSSLASIGTSGAMVISFDITRVSSTSFSVAEEARTASGRSGSTIYNTGSAKDSLMRLTLVINRTGAAMTLPGTLGSLADNSLAAYYYDGTTYSGLTISSGNVTSTSIAGFSTGLSLSNLSNGVTLEAYMDNFGAWNSLSDTVNGVSVLSLAPGTVLVPEPSSLALLIVGALAVVVWRVRKHAIA